MLSAHEKLINMEHKKYKLHLRYLQCIMSSSRRGSCGSVGHGPATAVEINGPIVSVSPMLGPSSQVAQVNNQTLLWPAVAVVVHACTEYVTFPSAVFRVFIHAPFAPPLNE